MNRGRRNGILSALLALLLTSALLLPGIPAAYAVDASGSCGSDLTWTLSAGTLTITGSGDMTDFTESAPAPWYPYRWEILRLELPDGLTSIGELAFYGCESLVAVSVPDRVTSIGGYAFLECGSLELLSLGSRLESIGEYAFSQCEKLQAVSLPGSLRTIGTKAFYRCQSLPSITVPAGVTSIGMLAFGYCENLVSANIQADIRTVPEFLFYECSRLSSVTLPATVSGIGSYVFQGCNQLSTVHYKGSAQTPDQVIEAISKDVPEFSTGGTVTDNASGGITTTTTTTTTPSGETVREDITVSEGDSTTISAKTETKDGVSDTQFNITIRDDKDWSGAQWVIESELKKIDFTPPGSGGQDSATANIYITGDGKVDADFMESMEDKEISLKVTTQDGSVWRMDGTRLTAKTSSGYDLRYTLSAGDQSLCDMLDVNNAFYLAFQKTAQVEAEVMIRLGTLWANQKATLFQWLEGEVSVVQTVVVDNQGYAHFYLAAVSKDTDYAIGMDLVSEAANAIAPQELAENYGTLVNIEPISYKITGRTSSWGMGLGQVMGILAVVMVTVIVAVGAVMYAMNRQKLKRGYIPDWDDEDLE